VETAESYAVYMLPNGHCEISSCCGNPEGFLRDLARSDFVDLLDQYVGRTNDRRYAVGHPAKVTFTPPSVPFTDNDMVAVVRAIASQGEHVYGVQLEYSIPTAVVREHLAQCEDLQSEPIRFGFRGWAFS